MLTSYTVKASSCRSASAGGVSNGQQAFAGKAALQRPPLPPSDYECSSASVSVVGQGARCFAADNGRSNPVLSPIMA
ncbi:MAG TPA: hypothetical protein VFI73_11145 [Candidatus Nitrosopolaris sp.]|nr:hypothetical protein [Candidatus Nitrosopolaris sp.]